MLSGTSTWSPLEKRQVSQGNRRLSSAPGVMEAATMPASRGLAIFGSASPERRRCRRIQTDMCTERRRDPRCPSPPPPLENGRRAFLLRYTGVTKAIGIRLAHKPPRSTTRVRQCIRQYLPGQSSVFTTTRRPGTGAVSEALSGPCRPLKYAFAVRIASSPLANTVAASGKAGGRGLRLQGRGAAWREIMLSRYLM